MSGWEVTIARVLTGCRVPGVRGKRVSAASSAGELLHRLKRSVRDCAR
jgi:hypothetical protein